MSHGFEVGRTYSRRADIHARFRGQQYGGIITPAQHPLVIIVTGEEGLSHGYADHYRPDGVFEYFGEGQQGNMALVRGNAAIAFHARDGKDLLLFRKTEGGVRFEGEMLYENHHLEIARDTTGAIRSAIVFELRRLDTVLEVLDHEPIPTGGSLVSLRQAAWESALPARPGRLGLRNVYDRSRDVRVYVLARAKGCCEGCGAPAPFQRLDGSPYLEPHHIRRLSDGGPDKPNFVIALCPNCHRRIHCGADGAGYNEELRSKMPGIEADYVAGAAQL